MTNTGAPSINPAGEPKREGQVLNANDGTWTFEDPSSQSITRQWVRCDSSGQNCGTVVGTATTYTVTASDVGNRLLLLVTATCTGCAPATRDSALTGVIRPDPSNDVPPAVSGTFRQGETVGGFPGTWTGTTPIFFAIRWQRCASPDAASCEDIPGAIDTGYRLQAADVNRRMRLVVVARNAAATSPDVASPMSAPVTARRRPGLLSPFPTIAIGGFGRVRGTDVTLLRVTGPRGATVTVRCRGKRCPFRRVRRTIGKKGRIRIKGLERRLPVGTRIEIRVTGPQAIGRFTRFRIRSLKRPARMDACLQPGESKPSPCP